MVYGAAKRGIDVALAVCLLVPLVPVASAVAALVAARDGRPVLYRSTRIGRGLRPFALWKFRTMALEEGPEVGVSGGDKAHRVTPLGRRLRATRLDEVPQLVNVLGGSMSFVGPRPPVAQYVERFPDLYAEILRDRPGITGLATVIFHGHEERLLAACRTSAETDAVYVRRCVPRKARLDRIYARNRSLGLDVYILYLTAAKLVPLPGARARRLRGRENPS